MIITCINSKNLTIMVYNNENISFINSDSYYEPDVFICFLSYESLNKKEETKENNRKE